MPWFTLQAESIFRADFFEANAIDRESLSREWAPQGVRVNSITPGFFPAEQNRRLLFNEDGSPTPRAQSILNHTPMARFGTSDELIDAAVFLASNRASGFVTGIDLRVDGGFLLQTI